MPLPRLDSTVAQYFAELPSTKQQIKFRPFLVKEEKILLLALESQDPLNITNALLEIIKACAPDVDVNQLTNVDVEYLFLQIRSKSVGESTKFTTDCTSCGQKNKHEVNVTELQLTNDDFGKKIVQLTDTISVEMQIPTFVKLQSSQALKNAKTAVDMLFAAVKESMISVMTEDEKFLISETSDQEVKEFLESMSGENFTKIREYTESIPKISHRIEYNCEGCGSDNEYTIEGIQSFFS